MIALTQFLSYYYTMKLLISIGFLFSILLTPVAAFAQGLPSWTEALVQCGQVQLNTPCEIDLPDGTSLPGNAVIEECDTCDAVLLAQRIVRFFIYLGLVLATGLFVYAGVLYVTSGQNSENISKAHRVFWSVLIGLVIVLGAWLIVDIVMKTLYGDGTNANGQRWGPWNEIICDSPGGPINQTCLAVGDGSVDFANINPNFANGLSVLPAPAAPTGNPVNAVGGTGGAGSQPIQIVTPGTPAAPPPGQGTASNGNPTTAPPSPQQPPQAGSSGQLGSGNASSGNTNGGGQTTIPGPPAIPQPPATGSNSSSNSSSGTQQPQPPQTPQAPPGGGTTASGPPISLQQAQQLVAGVQAGQFCSADASGIASFGPCFADLAACQASIAAGSGRQCREVVDPNSGGSAAPSAPAPPEPGLLCSITGFFCN